MFRLVDRPNLAPGCTLLGSTTGPVIDCERAMLRGGRPYLGRHEVWAAARLMPDVVEEMAAELGWLSPQAAKEFRDELGRLADELEQARGQQTRVVSLDDARELLQPTAA